MEPLGSILLLTLYCRSSSSRFKPSTSIKTNLTSIDINIIASATVITTTTSYYELEYLKIVPYKRSDFSTNRT